MIKSYKIFMGKKVFAELFGFCGAVLAVLLAVYAIKGCVKDETVYTFLENIAPTFCAFVLPGICAGATIAIFNANNRKNQTGTKFFHSLPNSAKHFKNAVIFQNIVTLVILSVFIGFFALMNGVEFALWMAAFGFLTIGMTNLFGYIQSAVSTIVMLLGIGFFGGFFMGFDEKHETKICLFVAAFGAAVFIGGFIYAAARAKSVWNKEDEKCAD